MDTPIGVTIYVSAGGIYREFSVGFYVTYMTGPIWTILSECLYVFSDMANHIWTHIYVPTYTCTQIWTSIYGRPYMDTPTCTLIYGHTYMEVHIWSRLKSYAAKKKFKKFLVHIGLSSKVAYGRIWIICVYLAISRFELILVFGTYMVVHIWTCPYMGPYMNHFPFAMCI